jgi:hypothetical protein
MFAATTDPTNTIFTYIYKNGSVYEYGNEVTATATTYPYGQVTSLVYMNGSSDYVECYGSVTGSAGTVSCGGTSFQAAMVRGA